MNQQLPARQPQRQMETAVERRNREAREGRQQFIIALSDQREAIERSLRVYDLPFDVFQAAVEVGVERIATSTPEFFLEVPVANFLREVARAANVGLKPDGKQGAIVKFKNDCTFMPMVEGYVEIIWKTGMVKDVNSGVVCEGDEFDFEEGDEGYVRHKRSLTRPAGAVAIGAWCVINLMTGGKIVEVVDQADLERIAKVNKAEKGPRANGWHLEMHKKAPFRRAVKRMPKTERLAVLIEIDDRHVKLETAVQVDPEAPSAQALFGNRAIRAPRKPPAALAAPKDAPMDIHMKEVSMADMTSTHPDLVEKGPADDDQDGARQQEALDNSGGGDTPATGAGEDKSPASDPPFVLRAIISTKNGLQEFDRVDLWFGDIRQKMQTLDGDKLRAFWTTNRPHIEAAGRHGHAPDAMKLMAFAAELGLIGGGRE